VTITLPDEASSLIAAAAEYNGLSVEAFVERCILEYALPHPNDASGCRVCGCMPCLCGGGKPEFALVGLPQKCERARAAAGWGKKNGK
jgi:hypothetical protein